MTNKRRRYQVGPRGPELFVSDRDGSIVPTPGARISDRSWYRAWAWFWMLFALVVTVALVFRPT